MSPARRCIVSPETHILNIRSEKCPRTPRQIATETITEGVEIVVPRQKRSIDGLGSRITLLGAAIYLMSAGDCFRNPLRLLRLPSFGLSAMAVLTIALIAVGLLGDGFMLYVLLKWLRE
jgi:hypothetical protein